MWKRKGLWLRFKTYRFLIKESVPATMFVSGIWIDSHLAEFRELSQEGLFEIENHGLNHRPLTISGRSVYGITSTRNISGVIEEVGLNAKKIKQLSGKKTKFYRSGTAYYDEISVRIANSLEHAAVNFDVLSGDAIPGASRDAITKRVVKDSKKGSIVIFHMNHPERNTRQAVEESVFLLRDKGYKFVKIEDYNLV